MVLKLFYPKCLVGMHVLTQYFCHQQYSRRENKCSKCSLIRHEIYPTEVKLFSKISTDMSMNPGCPSSHHRRACF